VTDFDPYAYLDAAARALELPIPAEQRDGVAANLARLALLAHQIMPFDAGGDADAAEAPRER